MERTRTVGKTPIKEELITKEEKIRTMLRYKVLSGTLRFGGRTILKGQVFDAFPEQIPTAFKRNIACVSEPGVQAIAIEEQQKYVVVKEIQYEVRPAKAQGWFNVVNIRNGKPINEKSLREEDANKLKDGLNII